MFNSMIKVIFVAFGIALLGACTTPSVPHRSEPNYRPVWPVTQAPQPVSASSLYQSSHNLRLFDDSRAREVGDIITIVLEEQTRSSKSAETSVRKSTDNEVLNPRLFGNTVRGSGPNDIVNSISSGTEFSGEGESDQSNSLNGTISAVIAAVLPNGLLQVQGEKWFQLNRGEEFVRISGLLRSEDISPDNSVSSLRLADARIAYSGTGELAQANRAGWLTRFFLGAVNPF